MVFYVTLLRFARRDGLRVGNPKHVVAGPANNLVDDSSHCYNDCDTVRWIHHAGSTVAQDTVNIHLFVLFTEVLTGSRLISSLPDCDLIR
jgi:hypothetical protein